MSCVGYDLGRSMGLRCRASDSFLAAPRFRLSGPPPSKRAVVCQGASFGNSGKAEVLPELQRWLKAPATPQPEPPIRPPKPSAPLDMRKMFCVFRSRCKTCGEVLGVDLEGVELFCLVQLWIKVGTIGSSLRMLENRNLVCIFALCDRC